MARLCGILTQQSLVRATLFEFPLDENKGIIKGQHLNFEMARMSHKDSAKLFFFTKVLPISLFLVGCGEQHSNSHPGLPESLIKVECNGDIEAVNSKPLYSEATINYNPNVIISGWVAKNAKEGILFDKVEIVINNNDGNSTRYDTFSTKRDDVSSYFGKYLDSAGFNAFVRRRELSGDVNLSVIAYKDGQAFLCKNINKIIRVR